MIVYLDQNKWIEIARVINGIDSSPESAVFLKELDVALKAGYLFPLSAIHLLEFARIKDPARRSRLGKVMWKISQRRTFAPQKEIVSREIEIAFAAMGFDVKPRELHLVGLGIAHAFGENIDDPIHAALEEQVDEAMLIGSTEIDAESIYHAPQKHRARFSQHLNSMNIRKHQIKKSSWDDWLYALAMKDIMEPLFQVTTKHGISESFMRGWDRKKLRQFLDLIPTRKLDIHLHRQVLKNNQYKSKLSDLEDWAGLGVAMCYCDIVICEAHFANLVAREGYTPKARVETSIYELFPRTL
ncbi:MAG: hypothetical protein ACXV8U_20515 [Methylobacter sp.]